MSLWGVGGGGTYFSSAPSGPYARTGSQTFHSSKQIFCLRVPGGILFSMCARSMRAAVVWMARSAALGAVSYINIYFILFENLHANHPSHVFPFITLFFSDIGRENSPVAFIRWFSSAVYICILCISIKHP